VTNSVQKRCSVVAREKRTKAFAFARLARQIAPSKLSFLPIRWLPGGHAFAAASAYGLFSERTVARAAKACSADSLADLTMLRLLGAPEPSVRLALPQAFVQPGLISRAEGRPHRLAIVDVRVVLGARVDGFDQGLDPHGKVGIGS
jgi:hypothetical protein